ncbi:hypothetical protein BGZ80_004223 [Entomortierella chlamydospora]|uniref:PARP-type domain-containing protein n=1 Tax=Entomortierella chlamydospora TaxID=101097 RepID=A0A9P6MN16_9FUNG|nr:hypothetical protein BGZ79_010344 [Entomortierella chlamydospora]KAG0007787.1 hypothetical protein BGZ80_004223 [Entomortierella chlamydospora]
MVVITYCVEYAESQKSVCLKCNKIIPNKSLRVGRMERTSEKEKKKFAKFRWFHFKCFEVPEIMTRIPVHLIRGQVNLLDKDKVRLEKVIKLGVGGSWSQIVDQHKKKVKEEEDAAAAEALANGTPIPVATKSKSDPDFDSDDEDSGTRDFTAQLTGEVDKKQERKNRKINKLKAKTDGAKVAKKQPGGKGGAAAGSKGKSAGSSSGKQMSAVEKAIAASRAESKKKLEQMQSKFGKK